MRTPKRRPTCLARGKTNVCFHARGTYSTSKCAAWMKEYRSFSLYAGRRFLRLRVFNPIR
ncbi:hypothetical protein C8Q77DRAFT_1128733 [Trametes polyzona]|nr:hypothetical protein C8Q77DRAFT_1128733 [Trametes polyzona]